MTKEEKIQQAYGEHWEKVKNFIDKDGWLDARSFYKEETHKGLFGLTMEILDPYDPKYCYWKRPVSLSGIENNNGWIKIESDDDLPKEVDTYYLFNNYTKKIESRFYVPTNVNDKILFRQYSHYQPIEKPEPPIY